MKCKGFKIGAVEVRTPIVQGGMGVGISMSRLAGTVAREGGIGTISAAQIGYLDEEYDKNPTETNLRVLKEEIKKARTIAKGGILAVNIMVATRGYERYVKAALEEKIDMIVCGAGLPMTLPKLAENTDTLLVPIVSSVKSLQVICKYWLKKYDRLPDMIIIEGPKAGGHLGFSKKQLEELTEVDYEKEILAIIHKTKEFGTMQNKNIPVVIAGGIFDRKDVMHARELGADGVQLATRFVTTFECDAVDAFKQAYLQAKKEDIVIVQSPVGMPGRAICNHFIKKTREGKIPHGTCNGCISTCKPLETPYCITEALCNSAKGNIEEGLIFCGSNAYRCEKMISVKELMDELTGNTE